MTALHLNLHASCVVVGEAGILITGEPGAGKSALARTLIMAGRAKGAFAALISDDRVLLSSRNGRLVARPHPAIAGLLEVRGTGIVPVQWEAATVIGLVADLHNSPVPRLPEEAGRAVTLLGIELPRIHLDARQPQTENAALLLFRLQN